MLQSEANVADPAPCAFPIHSIMTCKQRRFAARRHPRATNALPVFAAPILDTEGRSREGAQGSPTSAADVYARAVKNALSTDQVSAPLQCCALKVVQVSKSYVSHATSSHNGP